MSIIVDKKLGKWQIKSYKYVKEQSKLLNFQKDKVTHTKLTNDIVVNGIEDVVVVNENVAVINCYTLIVNVDDVIIKYACR